MLGDVPTNIDGNASKERMDGLASIGRARPEELELRGGNKWMGCRIRMDEERGAE